MSRRKDAEPYEGASEAVKAQLLLEGGVQALGWLHQLEAPWWMPASIWKRRATRHLSDACGRMLRIAEAADEDER